MNHNGQKIEASEYLKLFAKYIDPNILIHTSLGNQPNQILLVMTGGKTHGNNCWMYINIKDGIDQCFSIALNPGIELNQMYIFDLTCAKKLINPNQFQLHKTHIKINHISISTHNLTMHILPIQSIQMQKLGSLHY